MEAFRQRVVLLLYRGGAFHHLANMALLQQLPTDFHPAQVREGLY